MGNIIDYAREEQRSFEELPFNEVDALILAQLAYEDIPRLVPALDDERNMYGTFRGRMHHFPMDRHNLRQSAKALLRAPFSAITLKQMDEVLHGGADSACQHQVHAVNFTDPAIMHSFVRTVAANPRFSGLRVGAFAERFDTDEQTQTAALTFLLPDGTLVLSFRGTDDSLVGWKEDFNMAFQYPVPAQRMAADYICAVAKLWPGDMILTGHSKGGNSAVYAAMNAPAKIRKRIAAVYSLDGPGFPEHVVTSEPYLSTVSKVHKIVPDSSIIGMVLETPEPCVVVKADCEGLMQHFAFAWQVDGDAFVRVDDIAPSSHEFNSSFNRWMTGLSREEREHAVDALFQVVHASGATTFSGLIASMPLSLPSMIGAIVGLTPDERKHLMEAMRMLAAAATARNRNITR
ncbi:DUF2974 domain-containing protein [Bifidobacterium angulatum]|uniref:DUF2974 domain-containing protein n=1 Tax=Bifidobacterium angulatum TaxID=1683 RepID=UPI002E799209|nr:DUF2974 domain-containing protein [Bifidobacterium angulatum]MEE0332359.1 DUF2974 domain-containing protein [Bifidobacterium angulatum]